MRFLFHQDQATYDETNKVYQFVCTENLHNPTILVLEDCVFRATTMTSNEDYPHTVYLRSKAITEMLQREHTQEVRGNGTKIRSTIVAVLTQFDYSPISNLPLTPLPIG